MNTINSAETIIWGQMRIIALNPKKIVSHGARNFRIQSPYPCQQNILCILQYRKWKRKKEKKEKISKVQKISKSVCKFSISIFTFLTIFNRPSSGKCEKASVFYFFVFFFSQITIILNINVSFKQTIPSIRGSSLLKVQ